MPRHGPKELLSSRPQETAAPWLDSVEAPRFSDTYSHVMDHRAIEARRVLNYENLASSSNLAIVCQGIDSE